jgi:hypothetical protein
MSDNEDQKPTDGEDQKPGGEPITIRVRDQVRCDASHSYYNIPLFFCNSPRISVFSFYIVIWLDWRGNILQNQEVNKDVEGNENICRPKGSWRLHASIFSRWRPSAARWYSWIIGLGWSRSDWLYARTKRRVVVEAAEMGMIQTLLRYDIISSERGGYYYEQIR